MRRLVRFGVAALCCVVAAYAIAEELGPPLVKEEVERLVMGKSIHYLRKRDGARIGWDFRSGESVYYTTSQTTRNLTIAGTYRITDQGAVCFKWNSDKYLTLTDGCVRFRREGDKLHVVGFNDPDNIVGDVVPE